jgi:hypothetical protein
MMRRRIRMTYEEAENFLEWGVNCWMERVLV